MIHVKIFPILNVLCFYVNTFRSMCAAPNAAVLCISLVSHFPGMSLRYFRNYFEMAVDAPIIFVFIFL